MIFAVMSHVLLASKSDDTQLWLLTFAQKVTTVFVFLFPYSITESLGMRTSDKENSHLNILLPLVLMNFNKI